MSSKRENKEMYYIQIARDVSKRGTCLRRNFGAVLVVNDEIISTGYTGAPRGRENCCDRHECLREKLGVPRGERYELCRSVHAEQNCIISASRRDMKGGTLYVSGYTYGTDEIVENIDCCEMCKRFIINAGIERVIFDYPTAPFGYYEQKVSDWVENEVIPQV